MALLPAAVLAAATLMLPGGGALRAGVDVIHVTTTDDSLAVDGNCALREAVLAANSNVAVDACPAGSATEADTIWLASDVYELTIPGAGEDLAVTGDLDLLGHTSICCTGSIDGGGLDRVIDVHPTARVVVIDVDEITSGDAGPQDGGAIRVTHGCSTDGRTVLGVNFTAISNSRATNGGAIAVGACSVLRVTGVSLVGNAASRLGGGIFSDARAGLEVLLSTIGGNEGAEGGGIYATADGQDLRIVATTIARNTAGSGLAVAGGAGDVRLIDVLLAENAEGNCAITAAVDGHHNLSSDASCSDLGQASLHGADPKLQPLSLSRGLPVFELGPGSAAIDTGTTIQDEQQDDQIGNPRPMDGDGDGVAVADIGSIEALAPERPEPGSGGSAAPSPQGRLPDTAVPVATECRGRAACRFLDGHQSTQPD